jgi:NAD(P)-dependent dehydrogenase (short-subunit alcohol dehydrogenase family)
MSEILLTGGTGRIGSVLASSISKDGFDLVITTRDKKRAKEWEKSISFGSGKYKVEELNLGELDSYDKWAKTLTSKIDTVIYGARSIENLISDKTNRVNKKQWTDEFSMSVIQPYLLTYALLEANHPLRDIVFINSMYGVVAPNPNLYKNNNIESLPHYGTSKAAQLHLTKELAVRFSAQKIRVNAVSFGGVEGREDKDFNNRYSKLNPSNRMLNNNDLYPPIKFLISNRDLAYTGQNLLVDGGWTVW